MKKFLHAILVLLLSVSFVRSSPYTNDKLTFDSVLAYRLQSLIDSTRAVQGWVGVSAAVLIPNKGTWVGTSGVSHENVSITPGMYFNIASNTKTFISVLMLRLAELNALSLEDSLHKWLPSFQYVDSTITIRQLLNHTSGVYNYVNHPNFEYQINSDPNRFWQPEEILTNFLYPRYFFPGQGYRYSNTNYILAGMIIREAADTSVSHVLRQFVFTPAGLNNIFFALEEQWRDTIAHEWENGNDWSLIPRTSRFSSLWAGGAIMSTAEELVNFYHSLFDQQIINQALVNQMVTVTPQSNYSYGLGLMREVRDNRTKFYHTGSWFGFRSCVYFDSLSKYCISVLINQRPADPYPLDTAMDRTILDQITSIIANLNEVTPDSYALHQNFPNPFNPVTKIRFDIPYSSEKLYLVRVVVFDILGREVTTLVNEKQSAGTYQVEFDGSSLSSGVYFYKLVVSPSNSIVEDFTDVKRMLLVK